MIIAIDFDGTLCTNEYPNIGAEHTYMIDFAKERQKHGDTIILWTCRRGKKLREAVKWCKERGLVFDYVNQNTWIMRRKFKFNPRKINADIYIDDKNYTIKDILEYMRGK